MSIEKTKSELSVIVGSQNILAGAADLEVYGKDWTRGYESAPSLVVLPRTTAEVAKVLAYCNQHDLKIVPSGGRTGLAAAAFATQGEIVLSLERMQSIVEVDVVGSAIVVEAGVRTQVVQQAAEEVGMFFGLDLASKGSSQIGGNIATNAGGTKLIRYGGMREQILGLEVVLASGEILDLNTNLRKDNCGYDLKQLFIGSEGTLGVITKATLKLMTKPKELRLICMTVNEFTQIPEILSRVHTRSMTLTAFEFFTEAALNLVLQFQKHLKDPFAERSPYYVLLEFESDLPDMEEAIQGLFETLLEEEIVSDGIIAGSTQEFRELWGLRENISESISQYGHVRKNDISLPIAQLEHFLADLQKKILSEASKEIQLILFGHIGDGNLHVNYIAPKSMDIQKFRQAAMTIEKQIFELLRTYRGSVSAEHGIGLSKKQDLVYSCMPNKVQWMKEIKKLFDPKNIMNPGKIFDL